MTTLNRQLLAQAWADWYSNDVTPRGPTWLQWAITALFCVLVAACFTVFGFAMNGLNGGTAWRDPQAWSTWYGRNLVVSCVIGFLAHALFQILIPRIGPARIRSWSNGRRALFFSGVPIVSVMVGWPLGVWLVAPEGSTWLSRFGLNTLVGTLLLSLLISFIFFQIFDAKARQAMAEKRDAESQLRLLQAQMEPHFLFNTLANVLTLIDIEPARAKQMLESFTDYLRATLQQLRHGDSTLGRELELAEAYLQLLQLRMEDRLRFRIDADAQARTAPLPPLLLQPLIENAIHHGLEPKLDGGSVVVHARVLAGSEGGQLVVTVTDDGLGLDAAPRRSTGNGIALDNIRQRLNALHGNAASLTLESLQPGTRATIKLPLDRSPA